MASEKPSLIKTLSYRTDMFTCEYSREDLAEYFNFIKNKRKNDTERVSGASDEHLHRE